MAVYSMFGDSPPADSALSEVDVVPRLQPRAGGHAPQEDDEQDGPVEPFFVDAVTSKNIALLTQIWRRRDSGFLAMRDGGEEVQIIPLSGGGFLDATDMIELGSSIGTVDISFDPHSSSEEGDWLGLGSLLFLVTSDLVQRRGPCATGPIELRPRPGFGLIAELPLVPSIREELLATSWRTGRSLLCFEAPSPELRHTVEILRYMGLVVALHCKDQPSKDPTEAPPTLLPCGELLLDMEFDLGGEDEPTVETHFSVEVSPDSEQRQLELVILARRAAARGEWSEAERHLVAARDHRMDNPLVLAWLAWVRLNLVGPEADAAELSGPLAWVELASTIAPHDPDILRLAGLVRQRIRSRS